MGSGSRSGSSREPAKGRRPIPGSTRPSKTAGAPGKAGSARSGYYAAIQRAVCRIPPGKVATYGDVARAAGFPGTARQVAWALRNASARGIPWQRVLGSGGRILLPGEAGLEQRMRLELEGVLIKGARVDMARCAFRFGRR